jgi:hypothetical protein
MYCRCKIIVDRRLRGACCLHHQGSLIAQLEAACTSETSVYNHFTRQYIPEDKSELHTRRRENLKSQIYIVFLIERVKGFRSVTTRVWAARHAFLFWSLCIAVSLGLTIVRFWPSYGRYVEFCSRWSVKLLVVPQLRPHHSGNWTIYCEYLVSVRPSKCMAGIMREI